MYAESNCHCFYCLVTRQIYGNIFRLFYFSLRGNRLSITIGRIVDRQIIKLQIYDRLKENVLGMWTILRKDRHYNVIAILMSESV